MKIDTIRSFSRSRSRTKSKLKKNNLETALPEYLVNSNFINTIKNKKIYLEIGSGYGDLCTAFSKQNPDISYIACEVYDDGISNTINLCKGENNIKNLWIFKGDGRELLAATNNNLIDTIIVAFPDPWPKKRHHKRRIINSEFLQVCSKKLKNGGTLLISTDDNSYKEWIANIIINQNFLSWEATSTENINKKPEWFVETKYYKKAISEGRQAAFIFLTKV